MGLQACICGIVVKPGGGSLDIPTPQISACPWPVNTEVSTVYPTIAQRELRPSQISPPLAMRALRHLQQLGVGSVPACSVFHDAQERLEAQSLWGTVTE